MNAVTAHHRPADWPAGGRRDTPEAVTRRFATGVAVLTCGTGETVHGVTVSTLALAAVEPPMVSVALRRGSRGLAELLRTPSFAVNGLAAQQEALARYFARRDRGTGLGCPAPEVWAGRTFGGVPLLGGAVGWLECRVERTVPVGDHELVLARVLNAARGGGLPLLNPALRPRPGPLPSPA
ncbi:flavin reductase family protein [Streptacidiphilus sp. ASG 303]|uniref:flavin reductase family protein n=1 Tax=Streptomycetaceae TaxID=2062 RepID=UPI001E3CAAC0|nr:flavin reductase family protein [Streptacidiphilus sp. ASG 303]MCD0484726.1 flavin reductase family protein [Streptacidiphilus sp. ASG 303]